MAVDIIEGLAEEFLIRKGKIVTKIKKKYAIENKIVGDDVTLHKSGETVKIFKNQEDITEQLLDIISQAKSLTDEDIILTGVLHEDLLTINDALFIKEDLKDLSWDKRRQEMNNLTFGGCITKSNLLITDEKEEFEELIKLMMQESKEVYVTDCDSPYDSKLIITGGEVDGETKGSEIITDEENQGIINTNTSDE